MAGKIGFLKWFKGLTAIKKTAFLIGCAVAVYTVFGILVAPLILKGVLEKKLPLFLHRHVTIEKIKLNPYTLSATVEGFTLARKSGSGRLLYFNRLFVDVESLSILKKALIVKSISLDGPAIDFDFLGDRAFSFSDLLISKQVEKETGAESGPAHFSINNIQITSGNIKYHDLPKEKDHQIADIDLSIPSVSNLPSNIETFVQPAFSAVINGTETSLGGLTKPFHDSLATELDINMQGINIPEYLAYVPNPTGLTLKSALMDINTKLTYVSENIDAARLSMTGSVVLRDVDVVDEKAQSYLKLPSFKIVMGDSNLLAKEVHFAEIRIDSPQMAIFRLADGGILPLSLLESAETVNEGQPIETEADNAGAPVTPVAMSIDSFILEKGDIVFSDRALENQADLSVSGISFNAESLSNIAGVKNGSISYAMLVNGTGKVEGAGSLALEPLILKSSLSIDSLQLKDFQPYVSEKVRILIASGTFEVQGDFEILVDQKSSPAVNFSGRSSVAGLAISDTVIGNELIKWQDLQLKKVDFSSSPLDIVIDEIALSDLYARVQVNDDGTLNFATLAVEDVNAEARDESISPLDEKESVVVDEEGQKQTIAINKVFLKNAQVQFIDKKIDPAYGAGLSQFNGSITGLASQAESRATVKFDGKIDQQASLIISGNINPLTEQQFADIKIDFTDFNLSPLSPYTGKYAGYKTEKGKLNLDLHYLIEGKKLESTNKVFLDQFTFGAGVDSSDATSLPVNLAISLLQNRQGEIHLDIPVSGDLDDPEFSIGGVVLKVIVNLIAKAATSPFALLGSLIPEGEDLQHIEFEPGSGELTKEAEEKIKLIVNVLYERPGLKMDMTGRVDHALDRKALAKMYMEKLVKIEKMKKGGSENDKKIDYQTIVVKPEEYPKYLNKAYKKALKAAAAEVRKVAKQVKPANEAERIAHMETFLLSGIQVEDEDLRLLAIDRANRVLRHLVEGGNIEPGRLFMIEPQLNEGKVDAQQLKTMVELSIK